MSFLNRETYFDVLIIKMVYTSAAKNYILVLIFNQAYNKSKQNGQLYLKKQNIPYVTAVFCLVHTNNHCSSFS